MSRRAPSLLFLAAGLALSASARDVVIYRCVGADGAVIVQNDARCPKGMHEQKRVLATPAPPRPAAVVVPAKPAVAPVAPAEVAPAPAVAEPVVVLAPPPALFACLTADAQRYYDDSGDGAGCAPMQTVGLDGRSASPAVACETVRNRCEPVPADGLCEAWAERRRTAEQALLFSPEQVDTARAELARVDGALAGTTCLR